jgi:MFS family permease
MYQNLRQLYIDSFSGLTRDIWLLSFITFINRSGSVVFFFLSIYLAIELNFSKIDIGYIMASYGVGSVAGSFVGGWLTDRIGYYRVMFWSLLLVGFLFFALSLVKTFWMFCLMGFLTSLIGDAFRPAGMASIVAYGGEELKTRSMSLYRLAINLGIGLGSAAAGILAGIFGYKVLFFVDGWTCIIAALLFIILMKEKKEIHEKAKDDAPKIIRHSAYKDGWYLIFVFCWFLNAMVFIQIFHVLPLFFKEELMMNEEGIGLLLSFNCFLIAIIEMPLVYILAEKKDQMGYIIWGVVLIGMSLVIFNIMGFNIYTGIVSMILFSIGEIINFPLSSSLALGRSNSNNRGQYMGLYSMAFAVGLIIAPLLGFRIAEDYGYAVLWNFMGGLAGIATMGLIYLRKKHLITVNT